MSNTPINFDMRINQYVKLRDMIKEIKDKHKAELEPYETALDGLNATILMHLNAVGSDSVKTPGGTAYRTTKVTASIADGDAFWNHVMSSGEFELIDRRANKTAVQDYIDRTGAPPPGINYSSIYEVGVRRPTKTK